MSPERPAPAGGADRELKGSLEFLQSTIDAIPAYTALLDATGRVVAVNSEWRRYASGHPLIGKSCGVGADYLAACRDATAQGGEGMVRLAERVEAVLNGDELELHQEYSHTHAGGARSWFEVHVTRFEGAGAWWAMVAQVNVTKRREAEEALRKSEERLVQAQKMEAIGQLAGGIAHDFNNILTAILGFTEFLLDELPADGPARKHAEQVHAGGLRAADLTKQLLAFSRKQMFELKVVGLNAVVDGIAKMLGRLLGEDIEVRLLLEAKPDDVRIDTGQMGQVITNLAVNARDAMPRGGTLVIETARVDADETYAAGHPEMRPGPYVMMAVTDTGTGMDASTLAHIFEPFFTTKEKGKGTGLGLATVFGIVKQSNGHLWVYSEPGRGTTFKVHLPLVSGRGEEQGTAPPARSLPRGTETVLVAEDEAMVRALASTILKGLGYSVLEAASGEEAFAAAVGTGRRFDLLLTDVVMPGMTGVDLAGKLMGHSPGTKVVYMSGYTSNVMVHHGVATSSIAFLQKPFTQEKLARKIRQVLDGA